MASTKPVKAAAGFAYSDVQPPPHFFRPAGGGRNCKLCEHPENMHPPVMRVDTGRRPSIESQRHSSRRSERRPPLDDRRPPSDERRSSSVERRPSLLERRTRRPSVESRPSVEKRSPPPPGSRPIVKAAAGSGAVPKKWACSSCTFENPVSKLFCLMCNGPKMASKPVAALVVVSGPIEVVAEPIIVLVIGQTGSGKSTFINTMVNYFRGGTLESLKVGIPTKYLKSTEPEGKSGSERNSEDQSQSQTQHPVDYKFQKDIQGKRYTFIFVDTPGLSDTRGIEQDGKNLEQILEHCIKLGSLHAIILIQNGTLARKTLDVKNTVYSLASNIPDSYTDDMLVVLTNTWKEESNFNINDLPFSPLDENVFYMNNSAFSKDPKTWTEEGKVLRQAGWNRAFRVLDDMMEALICRVAQAQGVDDFKKMQVERHRVKQVLHQARLQMIQLQQLADALEKADKDLKTHGADAEKFKEYTQNHEVETAEWKDTPYHNTLCSTCSEVCHQQCGLNEIPTKGSNMFMQCSAFSGGQNNCCQQCAQRGKTCDYTVHYHGKKIVVKTKKTIAKQLDDMKTAFDKAMDGKQRAEQKITDVASAKKAVEAAIKQKSNEVLDSCKQLQHLCRNFNLVDELNITLQQLEAEAKMLKSLEARTLADEFIASIKTLVKQLSKIPVARRPPPVRPPRRRPPPPSSPRPAPSVVQIFWEKLKLLGGSKKIDSKEQESGRDGDEAEEGDGLERKDFHGDEDAEEEQERVPDEVDDDGAEDWDEEKGDERHDGSVRGHGGYRSRGFRHPLPRPRPPPPRPRYRYQDGYQAFGYPPDDYYQDDGDYEYYPDSHSRRGGYRPPARHPPDYRPRFHEEQYPPDGYRRYQERYHAEESYPQHRPRYHERCKADEYPPRRPQERFYDEYPDSRPRYQDEDYHVDPDYRPRYQEEDYQADPEYRPRYQADDGYEDGYQRRDSGYRYGGRPRGGYTRGGRGGRPSRGSWVGGNGSGSRGSRGRGRGGGGRGAPSPQEEEEEEEEEEGPPSQDKDDLLFSLRGPPPGASRAKRREGGRGGDDDAADGDGGDEWGDEAYSDAGRGGGRGRGARGRGTRSTK